MSDIYCVEGRADIYCVEGRADSTWIDPCNMHTSLVVVDNPQFT